MFESKNKEQVNEGVNIVVHRHVGGKPDGTDLIMLSVYSKEEKAGLSHKYADALKLAFSDATKKHATERRQKRDEYAKKAGEQMAMIGRRLALYNSIVGWFFPWKRAQWTAKAQQVEKLIADTMGDLNNRLANPLHDLNEKEFATIMDIGRASLQASGLKLDETKCQEHAYPNLVMTYLVYA
jgi:hypothetical protein